MIFSGWASILLTCRQKELIGEQQSCLILHQSSCSFATLHCQNKTCAAYKIPPATQAMASLKERSIAKLKLTKSKEWKQYIKCWVSLHKIHYFFHRNITSSTLEMKKITDNSYQSILDMHMYVWYRKEQGSECNHLPDLILLTFRHCWPLLLWSCVWCQRGVHHWQDAVECYKINPSIIKYMSNYYSCILIDSYLWSIGVLTDA